MHVLLEHIATCKRSIALPCLSPHKSGEQWSQILPHAVHCIQPGSPHTTYSCIKHQQSPVMLCYAMLCYAMLCHAMLCYAMLCCAILCNAMPCYLMLCYAMLCHAMLCYAMLCYAMLCCAMLSSSNQAYSVLTGSGLCTPLPSSALVAAAVSTRHQLPHNCDQCQLHPLHNQLSYSLGLQQPVASGRDHHLVCLWYWCPVCHVGQASRGGPTC